MGSHTRDFYHSSLCPQRASKADARPFSDSGHSSFSSWGRSVPGTQRHRLSSCDFALRLRCVNPEPAHSEGEDGRRHLERRSRRARYVAGEPRQGRQGGEAKVEQRIEHTHAKGRGSPARGPSLQRQ